MKTHFLKVSLLLGIFIFLSCSDNENESNSQQNLSTLTQEDRDGLLFMLEEEKLARDTYSYMYSLWGVNQFSNIKNSEQSHMDAIANELDNFNIAYTILPEGQFSYPELQNFYDQFVIDGQISKLNALSIGATIEDLDIVDLEEYILETTNTSIIGIYESLKCGSRNHLRSYVSAIISNGGTYTPQFLSQSEFDEIIEGSHEQCN